MSYEPTNWKAGDTVTSAKLNKLEQGIASNVLVVNITIDEENETETLDKTWQEIFDADFAIAIDTYSTDEEQYKQWYSINLLKYPYVGGYAVIINNQAFTTDSADGYPVYSRVK